MIEPHGGLIYPLVVIVERATIDGAKVEGWGVVAGGRRLAALHWRAGFVSGNLHRAGPRPYPPHIGATWHGRAGASRAQPGRRARCRSCARCALKSG